jgi:hypothetical protein
MATITKDGYTYNTETKTRTSPTGKVVSIENMDAITPNLKADTPISLESLNQTNQLSLPEAKPEVSPTYTLTPLETFERDTQMRADASDKNYLDTQRAIGEAEARELDYQEELGASVNLKAFKNYERQLQAEQLALRRYKEDISGETSMSEAMTNAAINQEEARSLRKQADIAILGNMALGNYNEAIQTAKTKVEMELKPLTRQLDYYKTVMERNQDLLSTTQKSKLQSLYSDIERQKNKEEERLTKGNEMIIDAIQSDAPKSLIDNANNLLVNGGNVSDVARVLGKYTTSYIDYKIKKANLEKLNSENTQIANALKAAENSNGISFAQLSDKQQDTTLKLRDKYTSESKDFLTIRDAYNRIIVSAQDPSAAGDLALIFNYMKILDPGSTVREGEFANAQNSAGIPDVIRAKYNKVISGQRLAEDTRNDFVSRSKKLFEAQQSQQKTINDNYSMLSSSAGIPKEFVVRDISSAVDTKTENLNDAWNATVGQTNKSTTLLENLMKKIYGQSTN